MTTTHTDAPCDVDVVAIGASAGGVSALSSVLSRLPPAFFAAVLVVLPLDPHVRSHLASVLARGCRLPGELLRTGVVYVAPRAAHLVVRSGALVLTDTAVDGAAGLRAIKVSGGRTIVQDPASAAHRGMPSAAYVTGCADHILPLTEIGAALAELTPGQRDG